FVVPSFSPLSCPPFLLFSSVLGSLRAVPSFPTRRSSDLEQGRLRVGAAVGTGADTQARVEALIAADVDIIVVDTAHGHSKGVIEDRKSTTSELQSRFDLVCRLLLEKKKT